MWTKRAFRTDRLPHILGCDLARAPYVRGVENRLRKNDLNKSRAKKRFYLLRNLLWIEVNGRTFKLYGSSPKPREKNYAYYITHAKPDGKKVHVPCATVDDQIPEWLSGITVQDSLLPTIREIYRGEVKNVVGRNKEEKTAEIKKRLRQLLDEEARLGRLFITEKISEKTYDRLRTEWREKTGIAELNLAEIQRETSIHLDDLDLALVLMSRISELYERLEEEHRAALLRILAKRIIIDTQGKIVDYELNSPFSYLDRIVANLRSISVCRSSEQVALGVPLVHWITRRQVFMSPGAFLRKHLPSGAAELGRLPQSMHREVHNNDRDIRHSQSGDGYRSAP